MDSWLTLGFDSRPLGPLVVQTVAWLAAVVAGALVVRRRWVWPGLAGGVLGLAVSAASLVDTLQVRADDERRLGAHVFDAADPVDHDLPGFVADLELEPILGWLQATALLLVAITLVSGAVLSRRRARLAG